MGGKGGVFGNGLWAYRWELKHNIRTLKQAAHSGMQAGSLKSCIPVEPNPHTIQALYKPNLRNTLECWLQNSAPCRALAEVNVKLTLKANVKSLHDRFSQIKSQRG